ncbi:MAG: flagellar hook protein FlgE [Betaproteobacteria bacterium]|nr:flagellar hook protein FlgE [Betaproteobacteria bacterium]
MAFQQGLSGLNAASKGLDVIGNNIANSNTVGFKSSQAQFADVYANSLLGGGNAVGIGTQVATIAQQFSQGNVSSTSNPLDVAINGNGFFRMSDNGAITFSRNGQFQLDKAGFIVNAQGLSLTGYPVDANGLIVPSSPTPLQIPTGDIAPQVTTTMDATLNLDARLAQPVTATFDPADPTSYNNSTSLTLYDTLGNPHLLSMFFVKTATPNQWNTFATVDGTPAANVDLGGGAGVATPLDFSTGGVLTTAMPITATIDLAAVATDLGLVNGATTPLTFTMDFRGTSQFGSSFGVSSLAQNGYTSGRLAGLAVGQDGIIQGRYSNGQSRNIGQIVLANFNNPQGLKPLGNNQWAEASDSGPAAVGAPSTGSLGLLQASSVEESNVDLTAELVNMITMQRAYQANAQTIKTQDSILQTLVNLR